MDYLHKASESSSLASPEAPKREVNYKFHGTVKRTYGSRKSGSQNPSLSSTSTKDSIALTPSLTDSPTKTKRLIIDLQRSSLNDDVDEDNDRVLEKNRNMARGQNASGDGIADSFDDEAMSEETPCKRRRSGRLEKRRSDLVLLDDSDKKTTPLAATVSSSSSSPSSKAYNNNSWNEAALFESPDRQQGITRKEASDEQIPACRALTSTKASLESVVIPPPRSSTSRVLKDSGPTGQTSISSFFVAKTSAKGTGLLAKPSHSQQTINTHTSAVPMKGDKSNTVSIESVTPSHSFANSTSLDNSQLSSSSKTPSYTASSSNVKNTRLEQLFLAFSPDRTKYPSPVSSMSSSSSSSHLSSKRQNLVRSTTAGSRHKRFQCPQCGMPYVRGQPEDDAIHDRYHRAVVGGIDYPGYKNEAVVARFEEKESFELNRRLSGSFGAQESEARIVVISMSDASSSSFERKKVNEVMQVVNQELGSIELHWDQLKACKVFLYITSKKKVVGCVVAERIEQAYEVVSDVGPATAEPALPNAHGGPLSATSRQGSRSSSNTSSNSTQTSTKASLSSSSSTSSSLSSSLSSSGSAIFCSTQAQKAVCGISRIWVNAGHRRRGIATRLLDAVRESFVYACKLRREDLAFSQPTGDGRALAQRYLETEKFLVYVE